MAPNLRTGTAMFVTIPEPFTMKPVTSTRPELLSLEVKSKLFDPVIPFSDEYKKEAVELLAWINMLSGGALKSAFELKSDDIEKIPFRLLNPRGIQHISGDGSSQEHEAMESYVAASYCWQPTQESYPERDISDDFGNVAKTLPAPLGISLLLYNALLNERCSPSDGVWIDQVCINQDDEAEKQVSVNAMDIIYKCARAVVILLDDIEITKIEEEILQMYILEFEAQGAADEGSLHPHYDDNPPYMTTNTLMRTVFLKLVQSRYFSRAWCMHETRLGKQHVFLVCCEQLPDSSPMVFRFTDLFILHLLGLSTRAMLVPDQVGLILVLTKAMEDNMGIKRSSSSFMDVFAETFNNDAGGNPSIRSLQLRKLDANLDKLSIAMNTIGVGIAVSGKARDHENGLPPPTEDECCRRFTIVAIATWDPSALCSSGHELQTNGKQRSWMRWPLLRAISSYKLHRMGHWSIGFDPSPASSWIALQMGYFNRAGGLRWATQSRLNICIEFLQGCASMGIMIKEFGGKKLTLPGKVWRDLITQTLACVMDCGLEWLPSVGNDSFQRKFNTSSLKIGLQNLLTQEAAIQDSPGQFTLISTVDKQLEAQALVDLATYLICRGPAVETELDQTMEYWQPVCIANNTGSKALTFVQRLPEREVFCATPLILFPDYPDFYSELFRAWTLVKGEPEQEQQSNGEWVWKYHLMGKSRIFGQVMKREEEDAFATIVDKVRVYGPIDLSI